MKYKGARIRHLERQIARLEAELSSVKQSVSMITPIQPKPFTLGGGAIGLTPQGHKPPYLINECGPMRGNVPEKVN